MTGVQAADAAAVVVVVVVVVVDSFGVSNGSKLIVAVSDV